MRLFQHFFSQIYVFEREIFWCKKNVKIKLTLEVMATKFE